MTRRLLLAATLGALLMALCQAAFGLGHWKPGSHNSKHAIAKTWCGWNMLPPVCASGRQALCVARHESRFKRWAWSPTGDAGVWQANYAVHHRPGASVWEFRRRHARVWWQTRWAYGLWERSGWWPWMVYTRHGLCR